MIEVFTFSEPGGHAENEDAFEVRPLAPDGTAYLCALADGQGGRSGGAAALVSFGASLISPWAVLALSDGVWKYAGLDNVIQLAAEKRGPELIPAIRDRAGLKESGALQDDFTLVAFCGNGA